MEYGLRGVIGLTLTHFDHDVLILVLMEYGLRDIYYYHANQQFVSS